MTPSADAAGGETDHELAAPVLGPLVRAVRELGLSVEQPQVLGAGANVVVHLAPSPVVARVATLTAEMRGGAASYLLRERLISEALDQRGVNVVAPTRLVDPGPHLVDGLSFLLLERRTLEPITLGSADHAQAVGRSLVELSSALRDLPDLANDQSEDGGRSASELATDDGHPWREIETLVETVRPTTQPAAMDRICTVIGTLRADEPDDPWQLVHGDAHRVNVALSDGRVIWFDFEDANRRPLAWDLATLRRSWPAAGDVACRLLEVDPDGPSMRWHHELREVYALLWNLLYGQRHRRARTPTAERLNSWLAAH